MGKKAKKKSHGPPKVKKSTAITNPVSAKSGLGKKTLEDAIEAEKERKPCIHFERGVDLVKVLAKIKTAVEVKCEDCNQGVKKQSKGKVKNGKHRSAPSDSTSESKAIWVCLECGHFACAGVGLPTGAKSHAVRHVRQARHRLVIQWENPHLRWCFPCSVLLPVEKVVNHGENNDVLADLVKLMKERSSSCAADADSPWEESGSVTSVIKTEDPIQSVSDAKYGYVARGLINLGNTCYFNSIIQNLLALNTLRDYFLGEETCAGHLFTSLRKFYAETKPEIGSKNIINPEAIHAAISSKAPQFRGYDQHDSHELLRCLLDGLSSEELNYKKKINGSDDGGNSSNQAPTLVDAVFGGQVSSTVSCMECSHASRVFESFLDLSLPVPAKKPVSRKPQPATRAKKTRIPPKRAAKVRTKVKEPAMQPNSIAKPPMTSDPCDQRSTLAYDGTEGSSNGPSGLGLANTTEYSELDKNLEHVDDYTWMDILGGEMMQDEDALVSEDKEKFSATVAIGRDATDRGSTLLSREIECFPKGPLIVGNADTVSGCKSGEKLEHVDDSTWMARHGGEILQDEAALHAKDKQNLSETAADDIASPDQGCSSILVGTVDSSKHSDSGFNSLTVSTNISGPILQQSSVVPQSKYCGAECNFEMKSENPDDSTCKKFLGYEKMQVNNGLAGESEIFLSKETNEGEEALRNSPEALERENERAPNGSECCNATMLDGINIRAEVVLSSNDQASWDRMEKSSEQGELDYLGPDDTALSSNTMDTALNDRKDQINLLSGESNVLPNSSGDLWGELPLQVSHSEVLLLPYEEESFTSRGFVGGETARTSTITNAKEQDLEFDGFGDMFNDPENVAGPTIGPSLPGTSFMSNNSGDSDPDEVDTNSPVSVESCLCLFTKPEILCDENAWVCENCSKKLLAEKLRMKKMAKSATRTSGGDNDSDKTHEADSHDLEHSTQVAENYGLVGSDEGEINSDNVKVKRKASKRVLINKTPKILTIHLKRFSQDARGRLSKLNGHVSFREFLDLEPFMDSSCAEGKSLVYRLMGVVEHLGTMANGHYIAYVRGRKMETENDSPVWYKANDANVRQVSLDKVLCCDAYILFYEKF